MKSSAVLREKLEEIGGKVKEVRHLVDTNAVRSFALLPERRAEESIRLWLRIGQTSAKSSGKDLRDHRTTCRYANL